MFSLVTVLLFSLSSSALAQLPPPKCHELSPLTFAAQQKVNSLRVGREDKSALLVSQELLDAAFLHANDLRFYASNCTAGADTTARWSDRFPFTHVWKPCCVEASDDDPCTSRKPAEIAQNSNVGNGQEIAYEWNRAILSVDDVNEAMEDMYREDLLDKALERGSYSSLKISHLGASVSGNYVSIWLAADGTTGYTSCYVATSTRSPTQNGAEMSTTGNSIIFIVISMILGYTV